MSGGCLCGAVRYEIQPPWRWMVHCHCERCRRWGGVAHATGASVREEQFTLLQGESELRVYHEEPFVDRVFCGVCGSKLFTGPWRDPEQPFVQIALGTLDDDPGQRPLLHIRVASKARWFEIADDLPQLEGAG